MKRGHSEPLTVLMWVTSSFTPFRLNNGTLTLVEGLHTVLQFLFQTNQSDYAEYRMVVQKEASLDESPRSANQRAMREWSVKVSFICLSPAVAFKQLSSLARTVVLTSGTLSPMTSFSSELGLSFPFRLEASHVIDKSQVWVGCFSEGPKRTALLSTYKTNDSFAFQDEIGLSILKVCEIVPQGVLVFFPSYGLMNKMQNRWKQTGLLKLLKVLMHTHIVPQIGSVRIVAKPSVYLFYQALKLVQFEDKKNGPKFTRSMNKFESANAPDHLTGLTSNRTRLSGRPARSNLTGGLFFAVCRGKLSEGIDFPDHSARAVVIVGIPYPSKQDIRVSLKEEYNNQQRRTNTELLSGQDWYSLQSYRAVNQAIGRAIRHRFDYGAILLLDERYARATVSNNISKWSRTNLRNYDRFEVGMANLQKFFDKWSKVPPGPTAQSSAESDSPSCSDGNGSTTGSFEPFIGTSEASSSALESSQATYSSQEEVVSPNVAKEGRQTLVFDFMKVKKPAVNPKLNVNSIESPIASNTQCKVILPLPCLPKKCAGVAEDRSECDPPIVKETLCKENVDNKKKADDDVSDREEDFGIYRFKRRKWKRGSEVRGASLSGEVSKPVTVNHVSAHDDPAAIFFSDQSQGLTATNTHEKLATRNDNQDLDLRDPEEKELHERRWSQELPTSIEKDSELVQTNQNVEATIQELPQATLICDIAYDIEGSQSSTGAGTPVPGAQQIISGLSHSDGQVEERTQSDALSSFPEGLLKATGDWSITNLVSGVSFHVMCCRCSELLLHCTKVRFVHSLQVISYSFAVLLPRVPFDDGSLQHQHTIRRLQFNRSMTTLANC